MSIRLILTILMLFLFSTVYAQEIENIENKEPMVVADQLYWWEQEGNLGISITGKFYSLEEMAETFNLLKEIGTFKSEKWKLCNILVSVDFNANGDVATWKVSGPKPLLLSYVKELEARYNDKSLFYDFGYFFINFKPTAFWVKE